MDESEKRSMPEAPTPPVYKDKGREVEVKIRGQELLRHRFRRGIPDYLFPGQAIYDNWLSKIFGTQKGTVEHGEKRGLTRRQFFETVINAGAALLYGAAVYKIVESQQIIERLTNPVIGGQETATQSQEVVLLYFFNGVSPDPKVDGEKVFARDLAIASLGINADNKKPVNFLDLSTWGHSELTVYMGAMDRLFTDILTVSGRNNLRNNIDKYGGERSDVYRAQITKFEDYLQKNNQTGDTDMEQLKNFFRVDPVEKGGLGYSEDQWNLIADTLTAYRTSSLTPALKERVNKVNEGSGTSFRIP